MLVHRKSAHKFVDPIVLRVDASGVCPGCNGIFHTRLRVIRHVMDRRCVKCRDVVAGLAPQPLNVFDERVLKDRLERKSARQNGHSHPTARVQARTAQGKAIGHVQR